MKLPIEELSTAAFSPFGKIIAQPGRDQDAGGPGWGWWADVTATEADERPYAIGYLDLQPAPLSFDWAERHMHSDELLIPVGGDCLVYTGPPEHPEEPDRLPPLERFRVFRIRQGQGVVLGKGVWHGAPLAVDRPLNVVVLLRQGTGRTDGHVVRFPDRPVWIEV
jgi:ureidoglycolate lyase